MKPLRRLPRHDLRTFASEPEKPPEKRRLTLDLKPTPFLPCIDLTAPKNPALGAEYQHVLSHPVHVPSVQTFFYWTAQRIGTAVWPAYRFAEELGVHRCSVGEWLAALSWLGYLREAVCERFDTVIACYGVREPNAREQAVIDNTEIIVTPVPYDPWKDRDWDRHFINWTHPYFIDEVIDDHYSVFVDEHLIHTGSRRIRADGQVFLPMDNFRDEHDHPLFWTQAVKTAATPQGFHRIRPVKGSARYLQENGRPKAPPPSRRREIDQACGGGRPAIRRRFSAEETAEAADKANFEGWTEGPFVARCRDAESGGHSEEAPRSVKRPRADRQE